MHVSAYICLTTRRAAPQAADVRETCLGGGLGSRPSDAALAKIIVSFLKHVKLKPRKVETDGSHTKLAPPLLTKAAKEQNEVPWYLATVNGAERRKKKGTVCRQFFNSGARKKNTKKSSQYPRRRSVSILWVLLSPPNWIGCISTGRPPIHMHFFYQKCRDLDDIRVVSKID